MASWGLERAQVLKTLRPRMAVSAGAVAAVDALTLPVRYMVVVVGGVSASRTYVHWAAVVAAVRARGVAEPIVLVGAANGTGQRDRVMSAPGNAPCIDAVDRYGISQVFEIVRRSAFVVCTDGGLLHVANAAEVPTIALFNERIDPSYRLTPANRSIALYTPGAVSDIPPEEVANAVAEAWQQPIEGVRVVRV